MKKEGLPGIGMTLVGFFVILISALLGTKFILFLLLGIVFFFYGIVKLYVLRDKAKEKVAKEEHHARIVAHRTLYPSLPIKECPACTTLLPKKAAYCMHCGAKV